MTRFSEPGHILLSDRRLDADSQGGGGHPSLHSTKVSLDEDYIKCGDTSAKMEDMLMDDDVTVQDTPQDTPQNTPQDTPQDSLQVKEVVKNSK